MVKLKRIGIGRYTSDAGHVIQRVDRDATLAKEFGYPAGTEWYITYPGEIHPDEVVSTLREARETIAAELKS